MLGTACWWVLVGALAGDGYLRSGLIVLGAGDKALVNSSGDQKLHLS